MQRRPIRELVARGILPGKKTKTSFILSVEESFITFYTRYKIFITFFRRKFFLRFLNIFSINFVGH